MIPAMEFPKFCPDCGEERLVSIDGAIVQECRKCGFLWDRMVRPQAAMVRILLALTDSELLAVLKVLYPSVSKLVTHVAAQVGFSQSMVMRVLQGNRTNVEIDKALVAAYRQALIKIEVQGGEVTQPTQAAARSAPSPQPSKKLTNQDVIDMAALNLSEEVIVEKIRMTKATDFDTSVAGMKLLKANNVPDSVIVVMIKPRGIRAEMAMR
jgi:hypothetical protein